MRSRLARPLEFWYLYHTRWHEEAKRVFGGDRRHGKHKDHYSFMRASLDNKPHHARSSSAAAKLLTCSRGTEGWCRIAASSPFFGKPLLSFITTCSGEEQANQTIRITSITTPEA